MSETAQPERQQGEVLPCPFCGGSADAWDQNQLRQGAEESSWVAGCAGDDGECVAMLDRHYATRDRAVAAWNRRAAPPVQQPDAPGYLFVEMEGGRRVTLPWQHIVELLCAAGHNVYAQPGFRVQQPPQQRLRIGGD